MAQIKITIYTMAGFLFGLAGLMQMSRLRQGDPTVAAGAELDIIASVVIGGGVSARIVGHDKGRGGLVTVAPNIMHAARAVERDVLNYGLVCGFGSGVVSKLSFTSVWKRWKSE